MELRDDLAAAIAQIQGGAKGVLAALASIAAATTVAESRRASAEAAAVDARERHRTVADEVKAAEAALAAKEAELVAADEKGKAFIKGGQEESKRLIDEAAAKRDEIYRQIAAGNEALAAVQLKLDTANAELDAAREKIAQVKADALKALA